MPIQLTIEPGEYLINVACPQAQVPGFDPDDVGANPPTLVTMAIPEDGNFPIGSSGDGVGFPSTYFQYPVYPGSGASVGYSPQPLPPLRGSYMNPNIPGSSGSGIGTGYMPGGWRPPDYGYNAGSYTPPKPPPTSSTPPDYYQMYPERAPLPTPAVNLGGSNAIDWIANREDTNAWAKFTAVPPGIDTPMDWIYGKDTSAWAKYQMSAGQQGEIDTPEDWVYGYDRDEINDPRTNKSIFDSLMALPFGVYSWDRTSTAATG